MNKDILKSKQPAMIQPSISPLPRLYLPLLFLLLFFPRTLDQRLASPLFLLAMVTNLLVYSWKTHQTKIKRYLIPKDDY